jgi:hypothetical protein
MNKAMTTCGFLLVFCCVGCETQSIEYRSRPSWHTALSGGLPTEHVREDGTVMKFGSSNESSSLAVQKYMDAIVLEEKDEITGEITLRAILPEHVLKHTLTCLRDRKWGILYDQILSAKMKTYYEERENGREEFETFFTKHRRELAKTLQRILGGIGFGDVVVSEYENELIFTLSQRILRDYKFTTVSFVREDQFLKLQTIR